MKILYEVLGILALGFLLMIIVNGIGIALPWLKLPVLSLGDGVFLGGLSSALQGLVNGLVEVLGRDKDEKN